MSFRKIQVANLESDITHFNDPLITFNASESGANSTDLGLILERGTSTNVAFIWDESEDHFAVGITSSDGSTDTNVAFSSYADIKANSFIGNLTGAVTGTVSSLSNLSTSDLSEGTNLYYTDTRFDTSFGNKDTDDLTEGSNQYFTNARAQAVINTNSAGFITDYTVTESDVTTHQAALSITESQISDLSHYTDAQAINAVEGESTLNLSSTVTTITDTASGSSAGPIIELYRNNPTPSNANYLGQLKFLGENSTGGKKNFAKISGKISDYTSGAEDGTIEFAVLNNGSNDIVARINENGLYLNAGHTLKFEGTVANTSETTLTVANPSADRTITLPDATGTVALTSDISLSTLSITATATNINYLGGVTSNVQTQIDSKQATLTHNENSNPYVITSANATANATATLSLNAATLGFNLSNAISYSIFLNRMRLRNTEVSVNTTNGTLAFTADTLDENDEVDAVWIT